MLFFFFAVRGNTAAFSRTFDLHSKLSKVGIHLSFIKLAQLCHLAQIRVLEVDDTFSLQSATFVQWETKLSIPKKSNFSVHKKI